MPLPHPPGYRRPSQSQVDHRRVLLAGLLMASFAALLMWLGHRSARSPGAQLLPLRIEPLLAVVVGAGFCGVWGETMRQLALVARSKGSDQDLAAARSADRLPSGDNRG